MAKAQNARKREDPSQRERAEKCRGQVLLERLKPSKQTPQDTSQTSDAPFNIPFAEVRGNFPT